MFESNLNGTPDPTMTLSSSAEIIMKALMDMALLNFERSWYLFLKRLTYRILRHISTIIPTEFDSTFETMANTASS